MFTMVRISIVVVGSLLSPNQLFGAEVRISANEPAHQLQNANLNHQPDTSPTVWGTARRWEQLFRPVR